MPQPKPPEHEEILGDPRRLSALARTGLVDSPPEEAYDRLTRIVSKTLNAPVALLTFISDSRQYFKSTVGFTATDRPASESVCQYVISSADPMVVSDVREKPELRDNPAVPDMDIVAYAGVPVMAAGQPVGTLCAIDHKPRQWSQEDIDLLRDVAALTNTEIADRLTRRLQDEQRGQFMWFMNILPIAIYACDPAGNVTYYNARAATLWDNRPELGVSESAAFQNVWNGVSESETDSGLPASHVLHGRGPIDNREFVFGPRTVLVSCELLRDPAGGPAGAVTVMHDVTAVRQAQRLRDELLALVSHELRTPLTIINGMALLLQRRWDTLSAGDRETVVHDIVVSGRRMERSVENMLILSQIAHEMAEPEPILVRRIFDEALEEHYKDFPRSEVKVDVGEPVPVILGVPAWARLIVTNLLSNAEQYGDLTEPHVLESEIAGNRVVIRVCDAGPTLTPEEYEQIFEPFYRRSATSVRVPGAGLGLTVSRRLAEAQGGTLTARSRPDRDGTVLELTFPAVSPGDVGK